MTIMLDTNIIISAALFPNGRTAQAFFKALQPPYQPVICDYVVDELHRKFQEKFPHKVTELEAFLFNALAFITLVPTPEEVIDMENQLSLIHIYSSQGQSGRAQDRVPRFGAGGQEARRAEYGPAKEQMCIRDRRGRARWTRATSTTAPPT